MILVRSYYVSATKGVDVTSIGHEVRRTLRESKMEQGLVTVSIPFAGACLGIAEGAEVTQRTEALKKGLEPFLANGLISFLLPKTLTLAVEKGALVTDPWQDLFLVDYETTGKRREFRVQIQGESNEPPKGAPKGAS